MKKKGFTLIELIAVIAVLGVILTVVVPSIGNIVSDATKKSFKIDARNFLEIVETKIKEDDDFNPEEINIDNLREYLNVSNDNYKSVSIVEEEKYTYISLVGKGKWDGLVACGTFDDMKILDDVTKCHADSNPPVITLNGSNPVNMYINTSYIDAGAKATDKEDGDLTDKIVITGSVNPSVPGSYSVTYSVTDSSNNKTTLTRTVKVIDNELPTITFGTNGNSTYAKTRSTTVTVKDAGGVNASSLKYLWNTSTTALTESSFASATSFTNGGTITTPAGVTGSYYLWIIGKDTAGNTKISRSNVFNLDNTAPVITITGNSTITLLKGTTYIDQGATATDNIDTGVTVTSTGTVNSGVIGIYTITYNATDSSGNVAVSKTRTINVVDASAPVITLLGSNPVTLQCGTAYADAGATAVDDVDGNVTSKITATSTVNPNIVGTYYVTYTVKDNTGNTATLTRTVNVVDTIAPTYTSYAITNVTYSGYDIYVYGVSDSGSGVNRVQFPTWTDLNGLDDVQPNWQTNATASGVNQGNGTWYYRVNTSAHNNESGQYQTHVYLYDNQGNVSSFATSGASVPTAHGVPAGVYANNQIITYAGMQWIVIMDYGNLVLMMLYGDIGKISTPYCQTTQSVISYLKDTWIPSVPALYSDQQAGFIDYVMLPYWWWIGPDASIDGGKVSGTYPADPPRLYFTSNGSVAYSNCYGDGGAGIGHGVYSNGNVWDGSCYIYLQTACGTYIRPVLQIKES